MQKFLLFMCGFTIMMAFGSVISLHLPVVVSVLVLGIPIGLLVLVLVLPMRRRVVAERRSQVFVYVPVEQRMSTDQVTRPSVEGETERCQQWPGEGW